MPKAKAALLFLIAWLSCAIASPAHEIQPSIADFKASGDGRYQVRILTNAEALISLIGANHEDTSQSPNAATYDALRQMEPADLAARFEAFRPRFLEGMGLEFDGQPAAVDRVDIEVPETGDLFLPRDSFITVSGPLPPGSRTFTWAWDEAFGTSVIRVDLGPDRQEEGYSAYLRAGQKSEPIAIVGAPAPGLAKVIGNYLVLGFTHILPKGLDHILFVVGLFLLSTHLRPLLWQITAFTIAHTVTLALGALGIISVPAAIVEPLIAASIAYVAIENVFTDRLHAWRPFIVFGFGLLHGLGFASVLSEIGLSAAHFAAGLIAFNVGVELGQIAIIALCYFGFALWFGHKPWYRRMVAVPASLFIAVIALFWVYQRIFPG